MAITIGELVKQLETDYNADDVVNLNSKVEQLLKATQGKPKLYFTACQDRKGDWDCINLGVGNSKVSELLLILKTYLPEHKDKCICVYNHNKGEFGVMSNKLTSTRLCNIDCDKTIVDLPQVKQKVSDEAWLKFVVQIRKFKGQVGKLECTAQVIQLLRMQYPDVENVFYISNMTHRAWSDVVLNYPELTDDDKSLFTLQHGVYVCKKTSEELQALCDERKSPKYLVYNDMLTLEELIEKYPLVKPVIDRLFVKDGNVMKCKSSEILSAFAK